MPSTYSTNLKIELQATGENSGTWGTITNTNLGTALEQAIVGYGNPNYASDANLTLTYTDTNAAQAARALVLNVTSGVSLTGTRELVVPTIQKQYIVQNNTTGSQSITVKTSAGTGITVPNGRKAHLYVDGTNVIYMDDYVDINGGSIDGTTIGANSAAAGNFTTVDTTNIEVTNIKAKDGTAAATIADSTGVVSLSANPVLSGGTANGVLYLNGSKVATSGSALVFDGTNLGLGVTPSAWFSTFKAFQFGANGSSVFGRSENNTAAIASNAFVNSSGNFTYINTNTASYYQQLNGQHQFYTAPSGTAGNTISFTQAMTLDASGNLGVGTTSPAGADGKAIAVYNGSGAARLALKNNSTGDASGDGFQLAVSGTTAYIEQRENDALVITTNNTERARITAGGNLLLGTTGDYANLMVGASSNFPVLKISRTDASYNTGILALGDGNSTTNNVGIWRGAANSVGAGGNVLNIGGYDGIVFTASNAALGSQTERMRIDSSGNVGIGTASPASKLSFGSTIGLDFAVYEGAGGANKYGIGMGGAGTSPDPYRTRLYANGVEYLSIDTNGNVGINTVAPTNFGGKNLSIVAQANNAYASTLWVSGSYVMQALINEASSVMSIGARSNHKLDLCTNDTTRMTITNTGNVGIGTASPGARLEVSSASNQSALFKTSATGSYGAVQIFNTNTNGEASIGFRDSSDSDATSWVVGKSVGATDALGFYYGSTRMVIDTSGNVGIGGTAGADTKVNVLGTLPTSSNFSFGYRSGGTVPSGTTSLYAGFYSEGTTQATSFTLTNYQHFRVWQNGFGAGSTVTNQYGYYADSNLTGATNNYGFYSDIASGSNRWNFYAAGTADNYFAGNVYIATTSAQNNSRLRVVGSSTSGSNYTLLVEGSGGADNFYVRDDGEMYSLPTYNRTSASASNVGVDAAGGFFRSTSSLRYKTNVVDAAHGLADVLKLRSVTYKGKNDGDTVFGGLIAEEVHDAGLTEFVAYDKEGRPDALHYGNMVALLVKAVQELKAELEALKAA